MNPLEIVDAAATWAAMYCAWRAANDRYVDSRRAGWFVAAAWLISMVAIAL